MKTIVTHINPDLDALTSVWLLKRFGGKEFKEADLNFLPAGKTYKNKRVDSDEDVVHVDTGMGRFDHHQTADKTCAARLVYEWLSGKSRKVFKDEALARMIEVVEDVDWRAGDLAYPQADHDRYSLLFNERQIISGWYIKYPGQNNKMMDWAMGMLDGAYEGLKAKVRSEALFEVARKFKTKWGKGIAVETQDRGFMLLAFARGYKIAVTKDPKRGNVRIKGWGNDDINLSQVYKRIKKIDGKADWFFHASGKMLLNGSRVGGDMKASSLSLEEVVKIIQI